MSLERGLQQRGKNMILRRWVNRTVEEFTKMPEYKRAIRDPAEASSDQCGMFAARKASQEEAPYAVREGGGQYSGDRSSIEKEER